MFYLARYICGAIARPRQAFPAIVARPSIGSAVALGLLLGGLASLAESGLGDQHIARSSYVAMGALAAVTLLLWLGLLMTMVARLCRLNAPFEAVLTALAFACVPWCLWAPAALLEERSRPLHFVAMALLVLAAVWAIRLLWLGTAALFPTGAWRRALVAVPVAAVLLGIACAVVLYRPPALATIYPWRDRAGRYVVVHYPDGKPEADVAAILEGSDRAMERICALLQVTPPGFKIGVYLFPSAQLHARVADDGDDPETGYAYERDVSMVYDRWGEIADSVTHEMTHVVALHRLSPDIVPALNEGLAAYVEETLSGTDEPPSAAPTTDIPLRTLLRDEVFYDWSQATESGGNDWTHYEHAAALVRFLLKRFGLPKLKTLLVAYAQQPAAMAAADRLSRASEKVNGYTLAQLEYLWREAEEKSDTPDEETDRPATGGEGQDAPSDSGTSGPAAPTRR